MGWKFEGAVIDSKGDAGKNTLRTGTLSWGNVDNKADYKAVAIGFLICLNRRQLYYWAKIRSSLQSTPKRPHRHL